MKKSYTNIEINLDKIIVLLVITVLVISSVMQHNEIRDLQNQLESTNSTIQKITDNTKETSSKLNKLDDNTRIINKKVNVLDTEQTDQSADIMELQTDSNNLETRVTNTEASTSSLQNQVSTVSEKVNNFESTNGEEYERMVLTPEDASEMEAGLNVLDTTFANATDEQRDAISDAYRGGYLNLNGIV